MKIKTAAMALAMRLIETVLSAECETFSLNDYLLNIKEITDQRIVGRRLMREAKQYLGKLTKNIF